MSELEDEFQSLVEGQHGEAIRKKVKEAKEALQEAMKLSQEHGVPFSSDVVFGDMMIYTPPSYHDKFSAEEKSQANYILGFEPAWTKYEGNDGWTKWQSSSWCFDRDDNDDY